VMTVLRSRTVKKPRNRAFVVLWLLWFVGLLIHKVSTVKEAKGYTPVIRDSVS